MVRVVCLLLIFTSIFFFITLIAKNITYLQPHRAIFLLSNSFRYEDIRDYIWRKYGLDSPSDIRFNLTFENKEVSQEKIENTAKAIEKEITQIKKRTEKSEDPLLAIRDMIVQFIRRSDLSSLTEAKELLLSVSTDFVDQVLPGNKNSWSPYNYMLRNFTDYLIDLLSTLLEIAEKEVLESAKKITLSVSYGYAEKCFEKRYFFELDLVHKFLRDKADASIGESSIIFLNVMEHYQNIGEEFLNL